MLVATAREDVIEARVSAIEERRSMGFDVDEIGFSMLGREVNDAVFEGCVVRFRADLAAFLGGMVRLKNAGESQTFVSAPRSGRRGKRRGASHTKLNLRIPICKAVTKEKFLSTAPGRKPVFAKSGQL
jgi:hypothetical protein